MSCIRGNTAIRCGGLLLLENLVLTYCSVKLYTCTRPRARDSVNDRKMCLSKMSPINECRIDSAKK